MKSTCYKLVIFFMPLILVSACGTTTKVNVINSNYKARDKNCEIQFFKDNKPQKKYDEIAKIESHIKRDVFLGGEVQLEDEAYKELRVKTCELGGDAVIIDDSITTSASEMSHIHVWATVIKILSGAESNAGAGPYIGNINSVSATEIIVGSKDIAERVLMGDKLCLFSGENIIILRATFPMQTVAKCEVVSGNRKDIKFGMKVYKYLKK